MNDAIGNDLISTASTNLVSNQTFQSFFKGIYVTTNTTQSGDGMVYINPLAGDSRITLFYHNDDNDSLTFDLIMDEQTARAQNFVQDHVGTVFDGKLDDGIDDDVLYLQSMSSIRADVSIPTITNLSNVSINRAELIFEQLGDTTSSLFDVPLQLFLYHKNDTGGNELITDFVLEGTSQFGGGLEVENGTAFYKFDISRYVQRLILDRIDNNGMHLVIFPANILSDRIILGGGNHGTASARLNLIYTKLD